MNGCIAARMSRRGEDRQGVCMRQCLVVLGVAALTCGGGCSQPVTPQHKVDGAAFPAEVMEVDANPGRIRDAAPGAGSAYRMKSLANFEGIEEPLMRWNADAGKAEPKEA